MIGRCFGACGRSHKSLGICCGVGAGCAALSAFAVASARAAPLSRHLPWHRRGLRRSLGIYRGIGAGCAALSAFAVASARVAPLSRHLPRHRRGLRRSLGICRGIGAGCAALSAFAAASARVAPLSRHLPRHRRRLRRSLGICRGIGAGCEGVSMRFGIGVCKGECARVYAICSYVFQRGWNTSPPLVGMKALGSKKCRGDHMGRPYESFCCTCGVSSLSHRLRLSKCPSCRRLQRWR